MTDELDKDFENHKAVWESMYADMHPMPTIEKEQTDNINILMLGEKAALEREIRAAVELERGIEAPRRWYQNERFPLLPIWHYQPRDEWNEANIHFQWLVFRFWTMPMPALELGLELSATELHLVIELLYLRLTIYLPFPLAVERFVYNRLGRYPRKW